MTWKKSARVAITTAEERDEYRNGKKEQIWMIILNAKMH